MRRSWACGIVFVLGIGVLTACADTGTSGPQTLAAGDRVTIRYCNNQEARITEPGSLQGPAPAVVYVHGGAWVAGSDDTGGFIIDRIGPALARRGFVVVGLDYRLGPRGHWPDQIVDVKCAIRYLRANAGRFHIDPAEIGAWGVSAGGHLVSLLGTAGPSAGWDVGAYSNESSQMQAVVDMSGPSDLLTMANRGASALVTDSFISLLGRVPHRQLRSILRKASPTTYVKKGDPPFFILHSNNDVVVYPQQSKELARDLRRAGVPHELLTVSNGGHGFVGAGEVPSERAITGAVVDFFVRTLMEHEAPAHSG